MTMSCVYLIKSQRDGTYYTGMTDDIEKRVSEHNAGLVSSTKSRTPYSLIWHCVFASRAEALKFEKYLKTGSGSAFRNKHLV